MINDNDEYEPILLPYPNIDLETKNILKKTISTAVAIKELKGVARNTIPKSTNSICFFALLTHSNTVSFLSIKKQQYHH